jgi:hypothetical protein
MMLTPATHGPGASARPSERVGIRGVVGSGAVAEQATRQVTPAATANANLLALLFTGGSTGRFCATFPQGALIKPDHEGQAAYRAGTLWP